MHIKSRWSCTYFVVYHKATGEHSLSQRGTAFGGSISTRTTRGIIFMLSKKKRKWCHHKHLSSQQQHIAAKGRQQWERERERKTNKDYTYKPTTICVRELCVMDNTYTGGTFLYVTNTNDDIDWWWLIMLQFYCFNFISKQFLSVLHFAHFLMTILLVFSLPMSRLSF